MRQFIRNLLQFLGTERRNWGYFRLLLVVVGPLRFGVYQRESFHTNRAISMDFIHPAGIAVLDIPICGFLCCAPTRRALRA